MTDWFAPRRGGIESQLLGLAQALDRAGAVTEVITCLPGPANVEGVAVTRLDWPLVPGAKVAMPFGLERRLRAVLLAGNHDVVHVHPSVVAPFCLAGARAARALSLPLLVTFHSSMVTLPRTLHLAERMFGWTSGKVVLSGVSHAIARQIACIDPHMVPLVLPNGFDDGFWMSERDRQPPSPGEPFRIAAAMRLEATKRPLALVSAFAQARQIAGNAGGPDLHLTIAGEGSHAGRLRRAVAGMGLAGHVDLVGWLNRDSLRGLYQRSHAFLSASTKEAFGIAGLEARASGLPVVARAGTGMSDYLDDGQDGFLAGSDTELAQGLARLALQPDLLERMSGPRPALARFGWDAVAARHLEIYEGLAGAPWPEAGA